MTQNTVSLTILDKEYLIASPPEAEAGLRMAARLLNERMKQIRTSGRVLGTDRIAVMAALNLTYELLNGQAASAAHQDAIRQMIDKIEAVLPDEPAA
ncbi:cell division protein ZapA [Hahella sp. SMD15-11]|uniref:Cell division protein ZapA n=1 Tax=Thermohahella caldifontis TaxID=3142973 RepID=A0AB39UV57_9GAMM